MKKIKEWFSTGKTAVKKIGAINLGLVVLLAAVWLLIGSGDAIDAINTLNGNPIYKGSNGKKEVALTINVVWGDEFIEPILAVLKENNVKATFFIGGKWAEGSKELLGKIVADGHEIGSHSYDHEHMSKLSYEENLEAIRRSASAIYSSSGVTPEYFAPPYGEFSDNTLSAADALGFTTIMWSVDTIDWRGDGVNAIISRIKKNIHDGAIILAHPTKDTVTALPQIIDIVKQSGRSFVTVGELLG